MEMAYEKYRSIEELGTYKKDGLADIFAHVQQLLGDEGVLRAEQVPLFIDELKRVNERVHFPVEDEVMDDFEDIALGDVTEFAVVMNEMFNFQGDLADRVRILDEGLAISVPLDEILLGLLLTSFDSRRFPFFDGRIEAFLLEKLGLDNQSTSGQVRYRNYVRLIHTLVEYFQSLRSEVRIADLQDFLFTIVHSEKLQVESAFMYLYQKVLGN